MILIKMNPRREDHSINQLQSLHANLGRRIPKAPSQLPGDDADDVDFGDHHQAMRMNTASEDLKTIMGWESKALTDTFRPLAMSSIVDETKMQITDTTSTDVCQEKLQFPSAVIQIQARNQFSSATSMPAGVLRSRWGDMVFAPPTTTSESAPSSSSVSSDKDNVSSSSSSLKIGHDGTIRVPSGSGYRVMTPFPWRLHEILEEVEKKKLEHIVSWLPDGSGFQVHCQDTFSDVIIPMFFRHSRYKSFQRQLYLYGFRSMETQSLTRGRLT